MDAPLALLGTIWPPLLAGAVVTIEVAAGAFVIAMALGFLFSLAKTFLRQPVVTFVIDAYIEIFRNVPAMYSRSRSAALNST